MSKSRDAVEDIRTIDTVTATANAALPKAGGALTGTVTNFTSTGIDDNATSTAVTIDASENVMVGQTSVNTANNGHSFGANGNYAHHTSTESTTLILNRKTSNGDIVRLRKDNAAVGSIGTLGGATYFGSADSGIMFNGVNQNPTNGTSTRVDNTNDLGASSYRYKDIYLGGGAFLGGTATANKLEDYEEGVFIPTVRGSTNAGSFSIDSSGHKGRYTKIGDICSLSFVIAGTLSGATGSYTQFNLPFTVKAGTAATGTFSYVLTPNLNHLDFSSYVIAGQTLGYFLIKTGSAATPVYPAPSSFMPAGVQIYGTVTYTVA